MNLRKFQQISTFFSAKFNIFHKHQFWLIPTSIREDARGFEVVPESILDPSGVIPKQASTSFWLQTHVLVMWSSGPGLLLLLLTCLRRCPGWGSARGRKRCSGNEIPASGYRSSPSSAASCR